MSSRYEIRAPRVEDAEAIGRMHVQVWREAYAGLMSQETLDGLDVGRRASRWRLIAERELIGASLREEQTTLVAFAAEQRPVGFVTVGRPRDDDAPTAVAAVGDQRAGEPPRHRSGAAAAGPGVG